MAPLDSPHPPFGRDASSVPPPDDGRFRAIVELALDALLVFDDEGCCVEANAAAAALFATPAPEIVGQPLDRLIALPSPEDREVTAAVWAGLLAPGHQFRECVALRPAGERRLASCRLTLQFVPGFHLCQLRDDSDRKQVEHSYRTLVEITNTGYAIMDPAGRIVDANAEYVRLSGHTSLEQVAGRSSLDWTAPADRERYSTRLAACAAGAPLRNLEIDHCLAGGVIQPVEINASTIDTSEGLRVLALCRDISERRQAQEAEIGRAHV